MKKVLLIVLTAILLAVIGFGGYYMYKSSNRQFPSPTEEELNLIENLDHDIYVYNVSKICDEKLTGFDVTVGPTGWPWADKVMWEVALYEDNNYYYARLIFHEYMLWWSWDEPYIACKIPKCNVNGNLATNEKLRWEVLYNITHETLRTYSYSPYMPKSIVQKINGHSVTFGDYSCRYEKYFVICDESGKW